MSRLYVNISTTRADEGIACIVHVCHRARDQGVSEGATTVGPPQLTVTATKTSPAYFAQLLYTMPTDARNCA